MGKFSDTHLAGIFRREIWEVRCRREELGIPNGPSLKVRPWTKREIKRLGQEFDADVAERIGRSLDSVSRMRAKLGIPPIQFSKKWTPREDDMVRTKSTKEAAEKTGRTIGAVRVRRSYLRVGPKRQRWAPWELQMLGTATDTKIAQKLGRTRAAVLLKRISLKIPPAPRNRSGGLGAGEKDMQ